MIKKGYILICKLDFRNRNNKNVEFIKDELYVVTRPDHCTRNEKCIGVVGKAFYYESFRSRVTQTMNLTISYKEYDDMFETKQNRIRRIAKSFL